MTTIHHAANVIDLTISDDDDDDEHEDVRNEKVTTGATITPLGSATGTTTTAGCNNGNGHGYSGDSQTQLRQYFVVVVPTVPVSKSSPSRMIPTTSVSKRKKKRHRTRNDTFTYDDDNNDDTKTGIQPIDNIQMNPPFSTQQQQQQQQQQQWWNQCIQPPPPPQLQHNAKPLEYFIDTDFPPILQSIDGRLRNMETTINTGSSSTGSSSTGSKNSNSCINTTATNVVSPTTITKCHCGIIATPKQVQSDGPNYGRYYLCCGMTQQQQRQQQRHYHNQKSSSPIRPIIQRTKDDIIPVPTTTATTTKTTTNRISNDCNNQTSFTNHTSSSSISAVTTTGTTSVPPNADDFSTSGVSNQPIKPVIRNPYLHRSTITTTATMTTPQPQDHPITSNNNSSITTTINNNNKNNSNIDDRIVCAPCKFFQWDTTGVLGTINHHHGSDSSTSGYQMNRSSIRNHLSWYHFSMEQQCTLYNTTSNRHHNNNKKKIDVSHIQQGTVGDCWFLSALTVVAEQSYLIEQILLPHTDSLLNTLGRYEINLFLDGKWQPIIIDSYLPVLFQSLDPSNSEQKLTNKKSINVRNGIPVQINRKPPQPSSEYLAMSNGNTDKRIFNTSYCAVPVFCATPNRILWPALIEKAYAKAHGSYQQLSGGYIAEGLQDLTGAPCETYVLDASLSNDDDEMFWMKLLSFHTAGFVMGVATYSGGDGLVGGHAYSILDVIDIPDAVVGEQSKVTDYFSNKSNPTSIANDTNPQHEEPAIRTSIRLVRIRNPWGKREWTGDWSVSSDRWTRTLRKRLGTHTTYAKGDGTFYMSFHDMLQRFHHLDVAKTQQGWLHTSVDGCFMNGMDPLLSSKFVYRLSVNKTTQAYVSIIQPKKRSNTKSQYWYCDPSMILLRLVNDGSLYRWEHVACSLNGVSRQCHLEVFLEAGELYYCVPWSFMLSCDHPFRLVTYSGSQVTVQLLPETNGSSTDDSKVSSVREHVVRTLFSELVACNDGRHLHPIIDADGMKGIVLGTYGGTQSSCYILAINGSVDHYLSLRISCDTIDDTKFGCTVLKQNRNTIATRSTNYHDFDIPPLSQQFLLVVTHSGTRRRENKHISPSFRYVSTWMFASHKHVPTSKSSTTGSIMASFGNRMDVCPMGQNALILHCTVGNNSSLDATGCSGTIQTSFENASALLGREA